MQELFETSVDAIAVQSYLKIFWENWINIMVADTLPHCITRTSATMVLTMYTKWVLVYHDGEFQLHVP